jgi:hypothetical protein
VLLSPSIGVLSLLKTTGRCDMMVVASVADAPTSKGTAVSNPSEVAAQSRAAQGLPPKVEDPAACAKVARLISDRVDEVVAKAPPLSGGQRDQLRRILSTENIQKESWAGVDDPVNVTADIARLRALREG